MKSLQLRVVSLCFGHGVKVNLHRQLCLNVGKSCPRQRISSLIGITTHMTNVGSKLGYIMEVTSLPRRILVCGCGEGKGKWLVISKCVELTVFDEVVENV